MKKAIGIFSLLLLFVPAWGQPSKRGDPDMDDSWKITVNEMPASRKNRITDYVEIIQEQGGETRSVVSDILLSAGQAGVGVLIDVVTTQVVQLINLRNEQKREWHAMIERECNYTDSISSVKGLQDFYSDVSRRGPLDPSNINFDGISVRGMKDGHEVLYLSCHIDDNRLDHLFQHSKFYLVVDTLAFYPYASHLPNLGANNIYLRQGEKTERDNSFSYDERENLTVGMDLTLSSSWINQATMVMNNVELGHFSLEVPIPAHTEVFIYSKARIDRNRKLPREIKNKLSKQDTTYIDINGDSFVVPRSFMPINADNQMWGTGEYSLKVKFRESCRFSYNSPDNKKAKNWHQDYKQLKKMRKTGSEFGAFLRTIWTQNGNTLIKTLVKSGITKAAEEGKLVRGTGGGASSAGTTMTQSGQGGKK